MTCPKCGSQNLRLSRQSEWLDMLHLAARHKPFRCRECRLRFYAHPSVEDSKTAANSTNISHRPKPLLAKRTKRRLVEAAIFTAMLALFFVLLHYLTQEKAPTSDAAYAPSIAFPDDSASLAHNNPNKANIHPETATRGNG
jgi:hypothetical protein